LEQPRDTPVVFNYEILDVEEMVTFDLYYGSEENHDMAILHKTLKEPSGHIDFTTDNDGFYLVCLRQVLKKEQEGGHPVRFKMSINYGYDAEHYEKLAKERSFDAVNLDVRKLNDMLDMTLSEADYQKHKEVDYHEETVSINLAALWWPMLQISILMITGIFQVQHLKHFFKINKMI